MTYPARTPAYALSWLRRKGSVSLVVLLMSSLLLGCAPRVVTKVERVEVCPPVSLTEPTPEPVLQEETWRGVAGLALDLRAALRSANADKASIRASCPR